jgi:predicted nucleic acid-binding protein
MMKKYKDTPMDPADASLIAVAESMKFRQIFTIDSDFRIYRLSDGSALEMIP